MERQDPVQAVSAILRERYSGADSALLAGSVIRGDATTTSDLDLVVLYPTLERSFRESFHYAGWPVETFLHDCRTIEYFFIEKDLASGIGSMMWMVHDAVAVPADTALNRQVKERADSLLAAGPPAWSVAEIDYARYTITGLLDDLADPRNIGELRAIVAALYHVVGNHVLRTHGLWGATSKTIPRRLHVFDASLARRFDVAFGEGFRCHVGPLVAWIDGVLAPTGGRLFDGYSAYSDSAWRRDPP